MYNGHRRRILEILKARHVEHRKLEEIASIYGVSRQRVHQILKKHSDLLPLAQTADVHPLSAQTDLQRAAAVLGRKGYEARLARYGLPAIQQAARDAGRKGAGWLPDAGPAIEPLRQPSDDMESGSNSEGIEL